VILGTNSGGQDDEESSDGVTDPDANPGLPPGETDFERRGCNHPCIDVEGISDPETDVVPGFPLTAFWLDRLKIMVGEEELLAGETWGVVVDFLFYLLESAGDCGFESVLTIFLSRAPAFDLESLVVMAQRDVPRDRIKRGYEANRVR
jgi:hypothetical protein